MAAAVAPAWGLSMVHRASVDTVKGPSLGRVASRRSWLETSAVASFAAVVAGDPAPSRAVQAVDPSKVKSTPSGVKYVVVKEGVCPTTDPLGLAGSCGPSPGKYVILDYTGFLPDGKVFDTTERKNGKPLAFRIGEKQVIPGLEEVVLQMRPGEEVQALIPAKFAYGEKGVCTEDGECLIPPGTDLKYFLRLVRVAAAYG